MPAEARDVSLIQNVHMALGLTKSPIRWVLVFFPRAKRPGGQVNSYPPTTESKNEWSYTSIPPPPYAFMEWLGTNLFFFISHFRLVLNIVFLRLGDSPESEFYVPTFRFALFHLHRLCVRKKEPPSPPMKLEQTVRSETSAHKIHNFFLFT